MSSNSTKIRRMVTLSFLTATAIVLSIVESMIPIIPVPGAKLGLANLITLVILYMFSYKEAVLVTYIRIFLVALLSGLSLDPFLMGLLGGTFSLIVMGLIKKLGFGIVLVSLLGSISHQVGQITAIIILLNTKEILYYLYIMLPLGILSGIINGLIGQKLITNLKRKNQIE